MTSSEIINILKNEVLETYPSYGINIVIPSQSNDSNYLFQITTTENELQTLQNLTLNEFGMSIINLKECESLLKEVYPISEDTPLIILKNEKSTNVASEKNVQYEIYNPITYEKLDLSICLEQNSNIEVNIPIELDTETEKLYNSLKNEGYDLFDINNKFYIDICTQFTAENGADVLLDDRLLYFFSKIVDIITCPKNCIYNKFIFDTKSLSCQCSANNDNIDLENMNKLIGYPNFNPSLNGYKYTSYKTMKCHKLVFSSKHFDKNAGSIIVLIFFIVHVLFLIYFIIKDIASLKLVISKIVFEDNAKKEKTNTVNPILTFIEKNYRNNMKKKIDDKKFKESNKNLNKGEITVKDSKKNILYPPKKSRADKARINSAEKKEDTENLKLVEIVKKKKKVGRVHNIKNNKNLPFKKTKSGKKVDLDVESLKSDKIRKRKSIIDYEKERETKIKPSQEKIIIDNSNNQLTKYNKVKEIKPDLKSSIKNKKKSDKILDDYELNHLPYDEALELDKRSFCKIYWSILKRDELLLFTFFSCNDYNLFHIKIERFFCVILTLMAMNGFLFSDKSIHNLFLNGGVYDFGQQILQIILSIIITHVFEILLCFLSLTDNYIYKIKTLAKDDDIGDKIFVVLKGMKIKLIIFFVLVFFISAFYWYFISAFCAVYKNTQGIYILDCVISVIFYLIDPFIVYALFALLRVISLKNINNKKLECLYKTSRLCPIF